MIIDSHVNLHAPQFDEDREAVIARAREAGVALMVEISDRILQQVGITPGGEEALEDDGIDLDAPISLDD